MSLKCVIIRNENAHCLSKQPNQIDLVQLLDDLSIVEVHAASRSIQEASCATSEYSWLELQTFEYLTKFNHELDGHGPFFHIRLVSYLFDN